MNKFEKLLINSVDITKCVKCPNRSQLGRAAASMLLGAEYTAENCQPEQMVPDADLKNQLFDQGLAETPVGIRATPAYVKSESNATTNLQHPKYLNINFRFGISPLICPRDLPDLFL